MTTYYTISNGAGSFLGSTPLPISGAGIVTLSDPTNPYAQWSGSTFQNRGNGYYLSANGSYLRVTPAVYANWNYTLGSTEIWSYTSGNGFWSINYVNNSNSFSLIYDNAPFLTVALAPSLTTFPPTTSFFPPTTPFFPPTTLRPTTTFLPPTLPPTTTFLAPTSPPTLPPTFPPTTSFLPTTTTTLPTTTLSTTTLPPTTTLLPTLPPTTELITTSKPLTTPSTTASIQSSGLSTITITAIVTAVLAAIGIIVAIIYNKIKPAKL